MKNYSNNISSQESYSHNPEYKLAKARRGLAAAALALVAATSVAVLKEPAANFFLRAADSTKIEDMSTDLVEKNQGFTDNNFTLADYKENAANPDVLVDNNGIEAKEIRVCALASDEEIAISEGACFRNAPFVGDGVDTVTTIATAKQLIELDATNVGEYYIYSPENDSEDHFIGIKASELPEELASQLNTDDVDIYWVKAGEAMIQKRAVDSNTENDDIVQAPVNETSLAS